MRRVAVKDASGELRAPGATKGMHWVLPDEQDLVVAPQGETIDFYVGRKDVYLFTLPGNVAVTMAWWLIRWWVTRCWCGVRLRVWWWLLTLRYDEGLNAKAKAGRISGDANT